MIIELTWYEPRDGRKYESPLGGEIEAAEHYRIDCVECWYTKIRMEATKDAIVSAAADIENRFGLNPRLLPAFTSNHLDQLTWYEAIYVRYRCCGDEKSKALLGIGYELKLYGAEQRPTQLIARLGPKRKAEEEHIQAAFCLLCDQDPEYCRCHEDEDAEA